MVISSSGAAAPPMTAVLGIKPTPILQAPMMTKVNTKVFLRPIESPKWPKTAAPIGRDRKAAANVPSEAIVAISGLRFGKNTWGGNTSAAAVP